MKEKKMKEKNITEKGVSGSGSQEPRCSTNRTRARRRCLRMFYRILCSLSLRKKGY
jgi:hypothetical protein